MGKKPSRKGKFKIVPTKQAEVVGEMMALNPKDQARVRQQIENLRTAEATAKTKAQEAAARTKFNEEMAAEQAKIRAKRKKLGIVNPGTMYKFRYKGKPYLGLTLKIPPEQFDSAEDIVLCQYVFAESDLKNARKRAAKILRKSAIKKGKIVGGWQARPDKFLQRVLESS